MLALIAAALLTATSPLPPEPASGTTATAQPMEPRSSACFEQRIDNGVPYNVYVGDRACIAFDPPQLFSGIWVDHFEGSRWYADARTLADLPSHKQRVWLTIDERSVVPSGLRPPGSGHGYYVRFRGRQASDMNRPPLHGYGHFGIWPGLVLVDEIFEIVDLGPVPVGPTPPPPIQPSARGGPKLPLPTGGDAGACSRRHPGENQDP